MSGSIYGKLFQVSSWGESHGKAIGVVIDGCPAGLALTEEDIQPFLNRRKPGQSRYTTPRKEDDAVEILSGTFEGRTTGAPISMIVYNKSQRSADYSEIASYYRPGHADYTYDRKYGFRDYRGGGRSSARETIARVAAGAVAVKLLGELGVSFLTYTRSIGPVCIDTARFSAEEINNNPLYMPDAAAAKEAAAVLEECMQRQDSCGGTVECIVKGLPVGLGQPNFDKLPAVLGHAILSIGAVKGFEIGDGMAVARSFGSANNDAFYMTPEGTPAKRTNHSGGVLGGISDGSDLIFRVAFKPTPSIAAPQRTVNQSGEEIEISIHGRHDPIIVPRAVVVVESMAAIALTDLLFESMTSRMESIKAFFEK